MPMTVHEVRELARKIMKMTTADAAEVLVSSESSALTRFANNRINQNVAEENTQVSIRAVLGKRQGVAATNRLDDDSLRAACESAVRAAEVAPEDPAFPGLPGAELVKTVHRSAEATRAFDAEARARAVALDRRAVELARPERRRQGARRPALDRDRELARRRRRPGAHRRAGHRALDGAGLRQRLGVVPRHRRRQPRRRGDRRASGRPRASARPTPARSTPARYAVVLAPEAVSDIIDFLAYVGFSAKAVDEGRSFMSGKIGEKVMSELVTITDDALAPHAMGTTFDYEGQPRRRVVLIDKGVANQAGHRLVLGGQARRAQHRSRAARAQPLRPHADEPRDGAGRREPRRADRLGDARRVRDALPLRQRRGPDLGDADRHDPRRDLPDRERPAHAPAARTCASRKAPSRRSRTARA